MHWLLPLALVLLATLLVAAAHFFFTWYLARLSEPACAEAPDDTDRRNS